MTGRRERAKADKRARIIAAASALLDSEGYDRMTMAQVANDADVAAGTVFQYAATKAELLMLVTAERWDATLPELLGSAGRARTPETAIRRLLSPLSESATQEPEISMAVARELLFGAPGEHRTTVVALVAQLEDAIADVLREYGARSRADAGARLIVSGGLLELNRTRTGLASPTSIDPRLRDLVEIVVAGAIR